MDGLVLQNVTKRFGASVAVSSVSLEVPDGEYWVFLGPSGCGKTTTLRMIGGHEESTEGEILLGGRRLNGVPPARRDITTVFQHFALFPHMTVRQNVEFGLRMMKTSASGRAAKVAPLLEMVGLETLQDRKPDELSSGQKQRVALIRALIIEPKLLLLDEPFGDFDRLLQIQMRGEMRRFQRKMKRTFIHVTHNQEEAISLADKIAVMKDGKIQQVGSPLELYTQPANLFVASFIGENNLLPGQIVGSEDSLVVVRDAAGNLLHAQQSMTELTKGAKTTVCVRASRTRISKDLGATGRPNALRCRVFYIEYLGDTVRVHLRTPAGGEAIARLSDEQFFPNSVAEGEEVAAYWDTKEALLLN